MSENNDTDSKHPEPVVVATAEDRGDAEVTLAHLRSAGIEGFIVDEIEGGVLPVEGEDGIYVAVRGKDAAAARALLAPTDD